MEEARFHIVIPVVVVRLEMFIDRNVVNRRSSRCDFGLSACWFWFIALVDSHFRHFSYVLDAGSTTKVAAENASRLFSCRNS